MVHILFGEDLIGTRSNRFDGMFNYIFIFQEFRFTAFQSFPPALELYYQIGETIEPENKIREYDLMIWQRDGRVGAK